MTKARSEIVHPEITRWYHCISRCVRQAALLKGSTESNGWDRKQWIDSRLQFLSSIFGVSVAGYAVLDNHFHSLVRIDVERSRSWSAEEVARRWFRLFPPRDKKRRPIDLTSEYLRGFCDDVKWIEERRDRLSSISWFMKCLKEPLSRLANKEDGCKGAFFESRFKSIAVLDVESLLAVCTYIDLNPVAAGIAPTPEESPHTSISERVEHVRKLGQIDRMVSLQNSVVKPSELTSKLEDGLWLVPIENHRSVDSPREGMLDGFTLANYLMLVDQTGRISRAGKASIAPDLSPILERIGTSSKRWRRWVDLLSKERLYGSYIASSKQRLREVALKIGVHHLVNVLHECRETKPNATQAV